MSSYRVFARKYRPQTFDEVIGQEHITRTLQNAVAQNRLAQAYLFVGPRGIGKTSTARILAKALNCEKGPTITPCGVCDACREIAQGNSLDVLEIDGASNNSVEHVRELRENAAYAPAKGPYKIYLVDEVHMLSTAAFNALLKTLEEPPPHVKFIFATTEAQKVPATITSRCQRFDLRRIPAGLIAAHLQHIAAQEGITLEPAAADTVAKGADGGLRDAESMLDQLVAFCGGKITAEDVLTVFGFTSQETVEAFCEHIFAQDAGAALALVAGQAAAGKDLSRLIADVIAHLRDLLVRSVQPGAAVPVPRERLLALLDHFSEAESRLRWATDKRLYFDVAAIKAVHLLGEASLSDVIDTLAAIGGGGAPPERSSKPAPPARREAPAVAPVKEVPPRVLPAAESTIGEDEPVAILPAAIAGPEGIWREVAAVLTAESPIRFGWLERGEFAGSAAGKFRVRFPVSSQDHTESLFWDDVRRRAESALAEKTGDKVELVCEFTLEAAQVPEPPVEELPAAPEPVADTPTDSMQDFKNDPLIRKALEVFKAEVQMT
ncbi:MAG: DNA polymerase III subunit gamma/tau [Terrimicrobiaceae bacterium]|nr:DNA polymerase III subunit gamma/tau [Terrimicrobiaceae bacterium]